jgi:flavin reductase (DIM6/NTAB) family NADH-FMN oxidoreductase RutF
MLKIDPREHKTNVVHSYLLGAVAPRPIALASTVDKDGNPNLSPFSFFNVFSANPPVAVFSPARSGRTGNTKNTFDNIREVPEVVINVVNYAIVQQASLASTEYPKGVNEFEKSGLTPVASELIKPFRVKESPVHLECKVKDVIELGQGGGAGNLVICDIVMIHVNESILDANNSIDPHKIDLVARMGGDWYSRASGSSLFKVPKPLLSIGIGYGNLPDWIRQSNILTGNDLGMLGNTESIPEKKEVVEFIESHQLRSYYLSYNSDANQQEIEKLAQKYLHEQNIQDAWKILMGWVYLK